MILIESVTFETLIITRRLSSAFHYWARISTSTLPSPHAENATIRLSETSYTKTLYQQSQYNAADTFFFFLFLHSCFVLAFQTQTKMTFVIDVDVSCNRSVVTLMEYNGFVFWLLFRFPVEIKGINLSWMGTRIFICLSRMCENFPWYSKFDFG